MAILRTDSTFLDGKPIANTDPVTTTKNGLMVASDKIILNNLTRILTVSVPSSAWSGTEAPYAQTITVDGISVNDNPIIAPIYSTDNATAVLQKKAWNSVSKIETLDGSIAIICFEKKPMTDFTIQLKGV